MSIQDRVEFLITKHGSMRAAARAIQIDAAYLSRLRSGDKANPSAAILRKLGLKRVVSYELTQTKGTS